VIRVEFEFRVDNLCDYTFNFCWHNRQLDPGAHIPHQNGTEYTYRDMVDALKGETEVHIKGDVRKRLAQGMGADMSLIRKLVGAGRFESMRYSKYEVGESEKYVAVPMRDGSLVMRRVD